MPKDKKTFEQLKDEVRDTCWKGKVFDFASLEGKASAEQIEELRELCARKSMQRQFYEAGRLGEDLDFSVLEAGWSADDINTFKLNYGEGKKHPIDDHKAFKSDSYQLGEKIGSGAFGTVYKGWHIHLKPR